MKLLELLPIKSLRKSQANNKKLTGRLVSAYWDREQIYFAVTASKNKQLQAQHYGSLAYATGGNPLAALADHFKQSNIVVSQLVILLSRPELEQATLSLPPSSDDELPIMVSGAMEQQLGDSDSVPAVDFFRITSQRQAEESPIEVQAFALSQKNLEGLKNDAEQAGFRLVAIGSRQLSTVALLRQQVSIADRLNILVQLYPGEIELSLCESDQPRILRSIRVSADEVERRAELIVREVTRCLTLLPPEVEQLQQQWMVVCNSDEALRVAQSLEESSGGTVVRVDPLKDAEAPKSTPDDSMQITALPAGSLTGASWQVWHECLAVNLLAPKRPPAPPNPYIKPTAWSAAGLSVLSIVGYTMKTDVWSLQDEVMALQNRVQDTSKLAAKMQEKSDQTTLVENWLADQVDWLKVLGEISTRVPDGQDATVGRLTASTDGKQGVLDLSVQVIDPEKITQLESKLRSVKYSVSSKRISQSPEASEFPWRFETRIQFTIEPTDWRSFGPLESQPQVAASSAADGKQVKEQSP